MLDDQLPTWMLLFPAVEEEDIVVADDDAVSCRNERGDLAVGEDSRHHAYCGYLEGRRRMKRMERKCSWEGSRKKSIQDTESPTHHGRSTKARTQ